MNHWIIMKRNDLGRYVQIQTIPAKESDDLANIIANAAWGGPGKYHLLLYDKNNHRITGMLGAIHVSKYASTRKTCTHDENKK